MPVKKHTDDKGRQYYQYGKHGKKYYFTKGDSRSKYEARWKAIRQGKAISVSMFRVF